MAQWYLESSSSDRGVAGSTLAGGTVLCPCGKHFVLYLALVQPSKIPNMTENH